MEGELKRIKSFWQSRRDVYKLNYPHLFIQKKKGQDVFFKVKYDLNLYAVTLSQNDKDKFFLVPLNNELKLSKIEFRAKSAEERARWFVALSTSMKQG